MCYDHYLSANKFSSLNRNSVHVQSYTQSYTRHICILYIYICNRLPCKINRDTKNGKLEPKCSPSSWHSHSHLLSVLFASNRYGNETNHLQAAYKRTCAMNTWTHQTRETNPMQYQFPYLKENEHSWLCLVGPFVVMIENNQSSS